MTIPRASRIAAARRRRSGRFAVLVRREISAQSVATAVRSTGEGEVSAANASGAATGTASDVTRGAGTGVRTISPTTQISATAAIAIQERCVRAARAVLARID